MPPLQNYQKTNNASYPTFSLKYCFIIKNGVKNKNNIQPALLIQLSICVI